TLLNFCTEVFNLHLQFSFHFNFYFMGFIRGGKSGRRAFRRGARPPRPSGGAAFAQSGNCFSAAAGKYLSIPSPPGRIKPTYITGLWELYHREPLLSRGKSDFFQNASGRQKNGLPAGGGRLEFA
ncbi:MAG: hypothetical protein LUE91_00940, partial [Oscillospiraceae bacterium]|nr:hypothetical protein [Oscillospiraceae bacterium]